MRTRLYHIVKRSDWEALEEGASYEPPSLRLDGFIHLCTAPQLMATAARHFAEEQDLLVLVIDRDQLRDPVELVEAHGEQFPHLHGPLEPQAIVEVTPLPRFSDGGFMLPPQWQAWERYFRG